MKWENGKKERDGEEKKEGREEEVSGGRLSRVCPARLKEEGGSYQLLCKLTELLIPIQRALSHHDHAS